MADLIFEPPWYLLTALGLIGIGLLWQGNARQHRRMMLGGLGVLLLAIVIGIVGMLVQTDREIVLQRTRQVAASVEARDWTNFASLLDARVQLQPVYGSRDALVAGASLTVDRVNVRGISLSNFQVTTNPGEIVVDFQAIASVDMSAQRPFRTHWRFYWRKSANQWLLYRIDPLPGGDQPVDEIIKRMAK